MIFLSVFHSKFWVPGLLFFLSSGCWLHVQGGIICGIDNCLFLLGNFFWGMVVVVVVLVWWWSKLQN